MLTKLLKIKIIGIAVSLFLLYNPFMEIATHIAKSKLDYTVWQATNYILSNDSNPHSVFISPKHDLPAYTYLHRQEKRVKLLFPDIAPPFVRTKNEKMPVQYRIGFRE